MTGDRRGCAEHHGFADPRKLVIACKCTGCDGDLRSDGIHATGALGSLICSVCRCVYEIAATREIRR